MPHSSLLAELLDNRYSPLEALAQAWLSSGATAVSLWNRSGPVASWPACADDFQPDLIEKITLNGNKIGELRVAGIHTRSAQQRLRTEARLLSSITPYIEDTNRMAIELIEVRNQMLALYDLTKSSRNCLETTELLGHLSCKTAHLMKAEGAFFVLNLSEEPEIIIQFPENMLDPAIIERYLNSASADHYVVVQEEERGQDRNHFRSLLLLPFAFRGATKAAVGVINKLDGPFTSSDIKLLKAIAEYGGAEIENILLFEQSMVFNRLQAEMGAAQQLQVSLLPKEAPDVAGLDIYGVSKPALQVGGDFFDYFDRPWNPFTFAMGDIAGKGLPAAMLMAITRTVIRTEMNTRLYMTPASLLKSANFELYDDFNQLGLFATLFIGQYQVTTRELYYANAGHSPVIYCPAGGKARMLEADGTAIGILPDLSSSDQKINFRPDDVLVLGTDGLVEARDKHGLRFGYARFLQLVETLADKKACEIANTIFNELEGFGPAEQREDDQTLLVIKCKG
jgi:phosphoserine phosphatase RsbU/P